MNNNHKNKKNTLNNNIKSNQYNKEIKNNECKLKNQNIKKEINNCNTDEDIFLNNKKKLKEEIKKLSNKKQDLKLRMQANIENIQKKSENTIQDIRKEILNNFKEKLSIIVNQLNSVLIISEKKKLNKHSIIQGIELIKKSLSNTLKKIKHDQ